MPPAAMPDPVESAKEAGLRWMCDDQPGIRRVKSGKGFRYVDAEGKAVRDKETLARIRALAIPPAWTDVWICPSPRGHLQATGRDVKGRKQYRYHEKWRATRDETKYDRMIAFGHALPKIRRRVKADLARPGFPREKVLATLVSLMAKTLVRVGNEEYAKTNKSYGLTTLKNRHVEVNGSTLHLSFRGKAGQYHEISLTDPKLARIVDRLQSIPGQDLFQYVDEKGEIQKIGSEDVNGYLKEITGEEFTAKDFRTWAGTVLAVTALREIGPCAKKTEAKKNVVRATEQVAARLGNTVAVCRKSYIHPDVFECYLDGSLLDAITAAEQGAARTRPRGLSEDEKAVVAFLEARATG
ncbi:MAG TPA: DNA topoisomerase IB [Candidatus Thermoplasmatota archaeon]|nr:DNA topoisomerase IB [Candidatus Thermoplasmatota archaeon]